MVNRGTAVIEDYFEDLVEEMNQGTLQIACRHITFE